MRKSGKLISFISIAAIIFLYIPLFTVALFSINASKNGLVWGGFSLHWYTDLFKNEYILKAALNTFILAIVSTGISTVLGTFVAIGLYRFPWPKKVKKFMDLIMHLPVITPDIVFAVALVIAFGALRALFGIFELGMFTMIVSHITFQVAFVTLVVYSRLEIIGFDIEEAAYDLYADYKRMLFKILLPMLTPGIIAGAMLAFTLSLDDFVISFFTAGPKSVTLPLFIYASVKRGITPEVHALSTLVMLITVITILIMQKVLGKEQTSSLF